MKVSCLMASGLALSLSGMTFGQVQSAGPVYQGEPTVMIQQDEYQFDDGSTENLLGWTAGGTMAFIVQYQAAGGADTICEVRIINGSALYPGYGNGNGSPVSVGVWSDPNQDGNPTDAQLLVQVDTTVQGIDTDTYQTVAIPPTAVTGRFFVGAWIKHNPGQYVAPMDQSSGGYVANECWVFGGQNFNQTNPGTGNDYIYEMISIGFPTHFCVRASTCGSGQFSLNQTSGTCPGRVSFDATGATPGGNVALVFAANTGSFVIPNGACAGTQLGLGASNIQLVATRTADGSGTASFSGTAPNAACNRFLQAVDLSSCGTTNVAQIQ